MSDSPTRAKLIKTIAGLHTSGLSRARRDQFLALERRTVPRIYQWNPQQKFQLKRAPWRRRPPVDSSTKNRPVNPPPEFVVPNKMEAWFAITDKFGCDPCESPERPEGKSCVYYKDRSGQDPPRGPKVAFNARGENQCNNWASKKENVEAFYCKEGGGPPKGEVCKPTPAPVKAYSYNFETMQPTMSPTPQVP